MEDMFAGIVDRLRLLDPDRKALLAGRGFSHDVIEKMKFRSCGSYATATPWICNLPPEIFEAIKTPNVLIPYFDPDGKIIHVRPHKNGIKGAQAQIYVPYPYLGDDLSTMVIAESEFKALASCLMGVPAVGIPGISSFSKNKFNQLPDILKALNVKRAIICFDNEIKNNPAFPNFKADYTARYDTQFYAYIMASLLKTAGLEAGIAVLKDEWRVKGKADIDGCLAAGVSHEEYAKLIEKPMTAYAYKASWDLPLPHKSYMERRIDRFFYTGPVSEKFNCYYVKDEEGEKRLTNFIVKIIHTLYDHDGKAERLCRLISNYGSSKPILMTPEMMTTKTSFQKLCYEMGDYEFWGNDNDLRSVWRYSFMNQDGRTVVKLKSFGFDDDSGIWFFGNGAYLDDQFFPVDPEGIVWVDDVGYRIPEASDDFDPPTLASEKDADVTEKNILENLAHVVGPDRAKLLFSWGIGNFYMPEILVEWGIYPFLFLHGKQQSGKSTLANWISSFFGFTQKGVNFHGSSVVGILRGASQMSMVPVWLEEYRNGDPDIGKKNNFLRGIYDRSTILKGTKRENELKTYRARSTLIISGEEHPQDAALNSRCVIFPLYRDPESKGEMGYQWLQEHRGNFNGLGHQALTTKKIVWPKIRERVNEYLKSFVEDKTGKTIGDRNRIQVSILAGIADVILGASSAFSYFMGDFAANQENGVYSQQALYVFLEDIYHMTINKKTKVKLIKKFTGEENEGKVALWFALAYAEWELNFKGLRNSLPASRDALGSHLRNEAYFIETKPVKIGGNLARCHILDYNHPKFPQSLRSLIEATEESETIDGIMARTGEDVRTGT